MSLRVTLFFAAYRAVNALVCEESLRAADIASMPYYDKETRVEHCEGYGHHVRSALPSKQDEPEMVDNRGLANILRGL